MAIAYNLSGQEARLPTIDDVTHSHPDPDVARLAALPVAVLADVVDRLGHRSQAMDHTVRPIGQETASLAGRAFTIAAVASDTVLERPYDHEIAAVDATPAGAVVVLATGAFLEAAVWGELLTKRMLARGGVGIVTDGGVRDLAQMRLLEVSIYASAVTPRDSMGRLLVTGFGEPVSCAGVAVSPGDLIRGDEDGVIVVPRALAAAALAAAEEKLDLEQIVRDGLESGISAAELYDRYGIL